MTKARKFISNHQDSFGEFIKDSPLYVPPLTETTEPDKQPIFDYDNQDNAIFVMRPQAFTGTDFLSFIPSCHIPNFGV